MKPKNPTILFITIVLVVSIILSVSIPTLFYYLTDNPIIYGNIIDKSAEIPFSQYYSWQIVNINPTLSNKGEGWLTQSNRIPLGIRSAGTYYDTGYGFVLQVKVGLPFNPIMAITHTEFGIGEPYEHPNPLDPENWTRDVLLLPADSHDFYIDSAIVDWNIAVGGYMAMGFGGWIIMDQPYQIHAAYAGQNVTFQSRIFEVLIAVRGDDIIEGGGGTWQRIWYRTGNGGPTDAGWMILEYIITKQQLNEWTTTRLDPVTFKSLIDDLQTNQPLQERNPYPFAFHGMQNTISCPWLYVDSIDFEGAKIRIAFIYLEGGNDFLALGFGGARVVVRKFYHMKKY